MWTSATAMTIRAETKDYIRSPDRIWSHLVKWLKTFCICIGPISDKLPLFVYTKINMESFLCSECKYLLFFLVCLKKFMSLMLSQFGFIRIWQSIYIKTILAVLVVFIEIFVHLCIEKFESEVHHERGALLEYRLIQTVICFNKSRRNE